MGLGRCSIATRATSTWTWTASSASTSTRRAASTRSGSTTPGGVPDRCVPCGGEETSGRTGRRREDWPVDAQADRRGKLLNPKQRERALFGPLLPRARRYRREVPALGIIVVLLSGALGILAQRFLARRGTTDSQASAEGIPLTDLLTPVRILVALLLAFVLVQTFSSYQDASDAADDEAGAVSAEAAAAGLLPSPSGPNLVG